MPENKRKYNLLPLAIGAYVILSAIFSAIVALTSGASYWVVFLWCTIFWVAITIPTLFWSYVVEPKWWDTLPNATQEKIRNWGIGTVIVAVFVLAPLGMFGGDTWSGVGTVNLFPDGATSKNYRLTAEIGVKTGWWWSKEYTIKSVDWPNTGTSYFSDCVLGKPNFTCTDSEGRTWRIEVEQVPDKPSSEE